MLLISKTVVIFCYLCSVLLKVTKDLRDNVVVLNVHVLGFFQGDTAIIFATVLKTLKNISYYFKAFY